MKINQYLLEPISLTGPASCFKCDCSMGFQGGCWNTDFQSSFLDYVSQYSNIIKGIFMDIHIQMNFEYFLKIISLQIQFI